MNLAENQPATLAHKGPKSFDKLDLLLLALVLAVSLFVRLTHIHPAPSFDELWQMSIANGLGSPLSYYEFDTVYHDAIRQVSLEHKKPITALWSDMPGVLHPPGYLMALRVWREIFGESVFASHMLSMTCATVGLVFLYLTGRLTMDRWAASLLTLAAGCAQTQVYIAQEIRQYALLNMMGAIAIWSMTRVLVLGATRRRAVLLGAITLPIVLTHYFGFFGAAAIGVFGMLCLKPYRGTFIAVAAAGALFFLTAWVPIAVRQTHDMSVANLLNMPHRDLLFTLGMAAGVPFRLFAERDYQIEFTPVFSGVLFVLPWFLLRRFRPLLPWALWLCCTIGGLMLLDIVRVTRHVAYIRYDSIASPAVPLLFVGVFWPVRRWLAYVSGATILLLGVLYLVTKNPIVLEAQSFDDVVQVIEPRIEPGEAIVTCDLASKDRWRAPVWIMTLSNSYKVFPRTMVMLSKPMTPQIRDDLGTDRIWLVVDGDTDPLQLIPGGRIFKTYAGIKEGILVHHMTTGAEPSSTTRPGSGGAASTRAASADTSPATSTAP